MALALLAIPAGARDTTAELTIPRQRIESADFRVSGNLIRVDADGNRLSFPITIKAHWFPGVLRVLVEIGSISKTDVNSLVSTHIPAHILLQMRPNGQNSIQIAHPGDSAPSELSLDKWSDGPLGTGFSYEDFLDPQYFWPVQSVAENVRYGARDCYLVTSKPGAEERTNYAEIRTWLDRSVGFPVYAEKTLKASGAVREFTYLGLRSEQGVWSAHEIEAKMKGRQGSTLLIIERGTPKAKLSAADFGTAQLMHFLKR
jgi:hypothetical protein